MKHLYFTLLALSGLLALTACNKDDETTDLSSQPGSMRLSVENTVLDRNNVRQRLVLDQMQGVTAEGDTLSVSKLQYYLSNFALVDEDGGEFEIPDSYFFFNQSTGNISGLRTLTIDEIPAGKYTHLRFAVGIDSVPNRDISRTEGELDPGGANAMIWNWSSGYKFVRLEGSTNGDDGAVGQAFVYHIGNAASYSSATFGQNGPNYKEYSLAFPATVRINGASTPTINLRLKLEQFFQGPNLIDVETQYNPGHAGGSTIFGQNYGSGFFEIQSVAY